MWIHPNEKFGDVMWITWKLKQNDFNGWTEPLTSLNRKVSAIHLLESRIWVSQKSIEEVVSTLPFH